MSDEALVRRLRDAERRAKKDSLLELLFVDAADYIEHCHASQAVMAQEIERLTQERDEARLGNHSASEHEPTWSQLTDYWKHRAEAAERKVERLRKALKSLLDVFERCETGFTPHLEIRFAVRDSARAALDENRRNANDLHDA